MNDIIDEFWQLVISEDNKLQEKGFEKWQLFQKKYPDYDDKIKFALSPDFYAVYSSTNFHDCDIVGINCELNRKNKKRIKIYLYDWFNNYGDDVYFIITYDNIYQYTININNVEPVISWNNDIIEVVDNYKIRHRILLTDNSTIDIMCKTVGITKITRE